MDNHTKAELGSGAFYLVIYVGSLVHVLNEGDYLSAVIMTAGTIGGAFYAYLHLKSKKEEKEKCQHCQKH